MGIIIPKTYTKVETPIIFLAGPIRGAPNWQDQAIQIILEQQPDLTIATPRRGIRDEISQHILQGNENYFPRQRAWERHYLDLASRTGAILFWLPGETEHNCQKSYGAMTRIELGQWMANYRHDKTIKICFGTDGQFSEIDTIEYDLQLDAPDKKVHRTLEETCAEAIRLSYQ